jgi:hypothetical protein
LNDATAIYNNRFLWFLLLYGFIIMAFTLNYNSAYLDEAHNILMGKKVITGQYCYACKQYAGSVMIEPILSAMGIITVNPRARAVSIFRTWITAIVYCITRQLFGGYGLISAMLFLFRDITLPVKLATFDIVSAFLGLALLLLLLERRINHSHGNAYCFLRRPPPFFCQQ